MDEGRDKAEMIVAVNLGPSPYRPANVSKGEKRAPDDTPKSKRARLPAAEQDYVGRLEITMPLKDRAGNIAAGRQVAFRLDPRAYQVMPEKDRKAFESNDFGKLDNPKLKKAMESIVGLGAQRQKDLSHLENGDDLIFHIKERQTLGAGPYDTMFFGEIDPTSIVMLSDFDKGYQEPAVTVKANDLIPVGNGMAVVGPSYIWQFQKFSLIPEKTLKALFYDKSLPGVADEGIKIGDVLCIRTDDDGSEPKNAPLKTITGSWATRDGIVLCGPNLDFPARVTMGISFETGLRDDGAMFHGNPSLKVCHGYVDSIEKDDQGVTWLNVILVLTRDNLPSHLKFWRMRPDALLQTNLRTKVKPEWVLSAMQILPLPLHTCPESLSDNKLGISAALRRNCYVAGHLNVDQGSFRLVDGSYSRDYCSDVNGNDGLMQLSRLAARGGRITDPDYQSHDLWKQKFNKDSESQYGGRFEPKATLCAVEPFPAEQALPTIVNCARMLGGMATDAHLGVLRNSLLRFATSKAKRSKQRASPASFSPGVPGPVLFQLLQTHANGEYTTLLKEGAVVVSYKDIQNVDTMLGTKDGMFPLEGGAGIVQLLGPVDFTLNLYNTSKKVGQMPVETAEGSPEISFACFIALDRHGGQLSGALYEGGGGDGKKGDSKAARNHDPGIWPERSVVLYRAWEVL